MNGYSPALRLWDDLKRLLLVTAASIIIAVNFKCFVQVGGLVPSGFNGLSMLIQRVAAKFWQVEIPFSVINFPLNAVPALISFKFIGKRFTLFSCVSVVLTSLLTDWIPSVPLTEDKLVICIFGGVIFGFAVSLCLKGRATTGGTDFISIALSERWNKDAWNYILCANVTMLLISGLLFGWDGVLYSIIYQFTATQVIRALDASYKRTTLFIVTGEDNAPTIYESIRSTHHSATLMKGRGLFNGEERVMIYTVVESRQTERLKEQVLRADPHAFVNAVKTEQVAGNYYRTPRD